MFRRLTDWYLDRLVAKERANLPAVHLQSLLDRINEGILGARFFLETRDQRFVPLNLQQPTSEGLDIVSLLVTWSGEGIEPWETEEPAKDLGERLLGRDGIDAVVLLSRDPDSFVGYYVRIRPKS